MLDGVLSVSPEGSMYSLRELATPYPDLMIRLKSTLLSAGIGRVGVTQDEVRVVLVWSRDVVRT